MLIVEGGLWMSKKKLPRRERQQIRSGQMVVVPARSVQSQQPLTCAKRRCPDWMIRESQPIKMMKTSSREVREGGATKRAEKERTRALCAVCERQAERVQVIACSKGDWSL